MSVHNLTVNAERTCISAAGCDGQVGGLGQVATVVPPDSIVEVAVSLEVDPSTGLLLTTRTGHAGETEGKVDQGGD